MLKRLSANRFDLHEVIRHYIFTKILPSQQIYETRQRHFGYYAKLSAEANTQLNSLGQIHYFTQLTQDHSNLLIALEWSLVNVPTQGVVLASNLGRYWEARGLLKEGNKWLEQAASLCTESPVYVQARLYLKYFSMAIMMADFKKADHLYQPTQLLSKQSNDFALEAEFCNLAGLLATKQRHFEVAESLLNQGLTLAKQANDKVTKSYILLNFGHLYSVQQETKKSLDFYQASRALANERGDKRLEMIGLANTAFVYIILNQYDVSIELSQQALALAEMIDEKRFIATIKGNIGYTYWQLGDRHKGEQIYREHLLLLYEQGIMDNFVENLFELSGFWIDLGYADQAATLWFIAERFRLQFNYVPFYDYEKIKQKVLGDTPPKKPLDSPQLKLIKNNELLFRWLERGAVTL